MLVSRGLSTRSDSTNSDHQSVLTDTSSSQSSPQYKVPLYHTSDVTFAPPSGGMSAGIYARLFYMLHK